MSPFRDQAQHVKTIWARRFCGYGAVALALLATLGVKLYTLTQIARARTSVPWADQWVVVQELERHAHGEPLWPILWAPYWGHRLVIPRMLFFADAHWLSLASLTWLTLLLQLLHVVLLIALAWGLLGRRSFAGFLITVTVVLNLMLSPFQMENLVWGVQTMFPLVFVAGTGAFICMSLSSTSKRRTFLALCIVLAVASSYTMPNGILVWPVLVAQSIYLKQRRKVVVALAALGAVVIATYLWHYTRPIDWGMGAGGVLRHPIDAIMLVGLILGSPFRLTMAQDAAVGVATLALTGCIFTRALFSSRTDRRWFSALFAIVLFLFMSSLSLVAGRLTPKDLHFAGKDLLPGRYFTMICLFWTVIALLGLSTTQGRVLRILLLGIYGILFVSLMFANVPFQLEQAEGWADFFLGADAVGSAFFLDITDEQLQSLLWPSKQERDERLSFLRKHRLAIFHEPRAAYAGKRVSEVFLSPPTQCAGGIEKMMNLEGSSWRVSGWAWDINTHRPPDDILFADTTGTIIGLARGGLRHGYLPGFFVDPPSQPPPHAKFRHSEWLGYLKKGNETQWAQMTLYGLFRQNGKICTVR